MTGERGQSTVELVGLLPLLMLLAFGAYAVLAAHSATEQAGTAAEAAAIALIQGRDPRAAAHDALPERRAEVTVQADRVTVTVRPRVPLLADRLTARVTAHTGSEPTP